MNTYRVIYVDVTNEDAPLAHVAFIQSEIYKDAWQFTRGILRRDAKYAKRSLFSDAGATKRIEIPAVGDFTIAQISDAKPRNVKLDKSALQEILADPNAKAEDKLAAMSKMLGVK